MVWFAESQLVNISFLPAAMPRSIMPAYFRCSASLLWASLTVAFGAYQAHAQTYAESVVYRFCDQNPYNCPTGGGASALILGTDGNLYGTTYDGGSYPTSEPDGAGTVFKMTPSGTLTTLYYFCSLANCVDGSFPQQGVVEGTDGNFYGTTSEGGAVAGDYGTVFKMTPAGALLTLYSFCSKGSYPNCTDGWNPAGLVQGKDGNFYGVTSQGGSANNGTAFKITPSGTLTTLHTFGVGNEDDSYPLGALVQGTDGNFYGITEVSVFKMTPAGAFTTLSTFPFDWGPDANTTSLVQGADGDFYGTTEYGGANVADGSGAGTVFRITSGGVLTTLYNFCSEGGSACTDGEQPETGLIQGKNGNFYGTTAMGGAHNNNGTLFELTPAGVLTTLYSFCKLGGSSCTDGSSPYSGLLQTADGSLYGPAGGDVVEGESLALIYKLTSTANAASSTALTAAPNPASLGQTVTLTATVSGTVGTPTGSVTFSSDGSVLGTAKLNGAGVASVSFSTAGYSVGTYPVVAGYSGDSAYNTSQSAVVSVVLNQATPTLTYTATPNPVTPPNSVDLSVTVAGADGIPTGTVTFSLNGATLGSKSLDGGSATLTAGTKGLPYGTYPVVATYSGNPNYRSVQSAPLDVVLAKAATITALSGAPNPVTPPASITLIASVQHSGSGSSGVPTGTVTFYLQTASLGTATLNESGEASITASTKNVPPGTYALTVKYSGDSVDAASSSTPYDVTVN
jgi:uncharacterized repeat protein (TIGR03803 family)